MSKHFFKLSSFKKGDLNISFSWIFIIIVGSLFLILSWKIVSNYKHNADIKFRIKLQQSLETIFDKFAISTGTEDNSLAVVKNLFQNEPLTIECVDNISVLNINNILTTDNNYIKNYPTFMTEIRNGGNEVYIGSENFKFPFKITNMMLITSKKNLIVFDKNSDVGTQLYNKFRTTSYSKLNYLYLNFSNLNNFDYQYVQKYHLDTVTFVTDPIHNVPSNILNQINIPIYIVKINLSSKSYGTINYYDKSGLIKSFNYSDSNQNLVLPTLAVFSSPAIFECGYYKLFSSINYIYNFYIERAKVFENKTQVICENIYTLNEQKYKYSQIEQILKEIKNEVKINKFKNISKLNNKIETLKKLNKNLEDANCPYLY